ncbi:MAG: helix-turn-helix transcriptional regulator [Oscillospiraceae bacterium]|nr:helix-turn-helix transcriptional regulator [Oscillospiraceae bacterium]
MNIGERIYSLRTQKGLSQGDLAEKLEVSRQSVSKWENSSAVPDLDKIIKLSEIFGITIDELVKGNSHTVQSVENDDGKKTDSQKVEYVYVQSRKNAMETRKIAAVILFCMAFLLTFGILLATGSLGGIFYAVPFIVCGIICFAVRKNVGIWCAWSVYIMADVFMRWGTSINPNLIFMTFRFTPEMNYTRLAAAWIWVILLVSLIAFTAVRFKYMPVKDIKKLKIKLVCGWAAYILIYAGRMILARTEMYINMIFEIIKSNAAVYSFFSHIVNFADIFFATILIVHTVRYIYNRNKT